MLQTEPDTGFEIRLRGRERQRQTVPVGVLTVQKNPQPVCDRRGGDANSYRALGSTSARATSAPIIVNGTSTRPSANECLSEGLAPVARAAWYQR